MIENLSDEEILQRLKQRDEKVTNEFFYDTCRMAYCIDDKKYGLRYKTGMNFYALAHEYYLRLLNNGCRQLDKCKPGITLRNWMLNGFHYLVRERLNNYSKGNYEESIEERASHGEVVFDAPVDNSQEEVTEMVEEICQAYYQSDRKAQSILRMILIMGMKGKEVASLIGITPAAVSQRYHTMMDEVVRPYFIRYYAQPSYRFYLEESLLYLDQRNMESGAQSMSLSEARPKRSKRSKWSSSILGFSFGGFHHHVTPPVVLSLRDNEIFVFGSDLRGVHCGGTAYQALCNFGVQLGKGVGPQGSCYAIPTIVGGLDNIKPYVHEFAGYVASHPKQSFLVTPVGCDIAGFTPKDIAPLFAWAVNAANVSLPQDFWDVILRE